LNTENVEPTFASQKAHQKNFVPKVFKGCEIKKKCYLYDRSMNKNFIFSLAYIAVV